MSDWSPYVGDRLIKRLDGFVVIKPADSDPAVPLVCPLCDTLMRSREDEEAYLDFSCCHFCAMTWAHPRRQQWNEGWRPDPEQVKKALHSRPPNSLTLTLD